MHGKLQVLLNGQGNPGRQEAKGVNTRRFVVPNLIKVGIIWKVMISFLCVSALYATGYFWEPTRTPWVFGLVTFIGALVFWYDCRFIIGKPLECVPAIYDREVQR